MGAHSAGAYSAGAYVAPSTRAARRLQAAEPGPLLRLASWNVAAINNNPFEYWITHSAEYTSLMRDVQSFIDDPGEGDVALNLVFTCARTDGREGRGPLNPRVASAPARVRASPMRLHARFAPPPSRDAMADELGRLMAADGWSHVADALAEWRARYAGRAIVSGFMKDAKLGKKRLISMPDRMTNTINLADGSTATRPTVTNCYAGQFASMGEWWAQWRAWMFEAPALGLASGKRSKPSGLVGPISRAKYPALTEAEEAMSRPLSLLCQAAFDAVLVHTLDSIARGAHRATWQPLRSEMCSALNSRKNSRTVHILGRSYRDSDVIFLQEVSAALVGALRASPPLSRAFDVFVAPNDGKRDQNSAVMLRKERFETSSAVDHTAAFSALLASATDRAPVVAGDVVVLSVRERGTGEPYLLASFHGDTDGLATIPVTAALQRLWAEGCAGCPTKRARLLVGMDANTYQTHSKKRQGVLEFATAYRSLGMSSSWGDVPDPANITTFNARTYLQPQLNKAVAFQDLERPGVGDKNPKDFLLFERGRYRVLGHVKDNTGRKAYIEGQPFPTLAFPSDHGIISAVLQQAAP